MANISQANGTITATGTKKQIRNWVELQNQLDTSGYGFFLNDQDVFLNELKTEIQLRKHELNKDEIFSINESANGTGRWSLENSNEHYYNYIWDKISEENDDDKRNDLIEKLKTLSADTGFKLEFDFTDFEAGNSVFYSESSEILLKIDDELISKIDLEKQVKASFKDFDALTDTEKEAALKDVLEYNPVRTDATILEQEQIDINAANIIEAGLGDEDNTFDLSDNEEYGIPFAIELLHNTRTNQSVIDGLPDTMAALDENNPHNLDKNNFLDFIYKHRINFSKILAEKLANPSYIMYDELDILDEFDTEPEMVVDAINKTFEMEQ